MSKKLAFLFLALLTTSISCTPTHIQTVPTNCVQTGQSLENQPNSVVNEFGELVMWRPNNFPLRVVVDPEMRQERRNVVRQAIDEWNSIVELQVFIYSEGQQTGGNGTIWITETLLPTNNCGDQLYGLSTRYYERDWFGFITHIHHSKIQLHNSVPNDRILSTTVHELGHSLGLQHDSEMSSIMYPLNLQERGWITQEDVNYVRQMILRSNTQPVAPFVEMILKS